MFNRKNPFPNLLIKLSEQEQAVLYNFNEAVKDRDDDAVDTSWENFRFVGEIYFGTKIKRADGSETLIMSQVDFAPLFINLLRSGYKELTTNIWELNVEFRNFLILAGKSDDPLHRKIMQDMLSVLGKGSITDYKTYLKDFIGLIESEDVITFLLDNLRKADSLTRLQKKQKKLLEERLLTIDEEESIGEEESVDIEQTNTHKRVMETLAIAEQESSSSSSNAESSNTDGASNSAKRQKTMPQQDITSKLAEAYQSLLDQSRFPPKLGIFGDSLIVGTSSQEIEDAAPTLQSPNCT